MTPVRQLDAAVRTGWEPYLQQAARLTEAVRVEPERAEHQRKHTRLRV